MLFFKSRKHKEIDEEIERKEKLISKTKQQFHNRADSEMDTLRKINRVLGNGITLQIHHASHGDGHD